MKTVKFALLLVTSCTIITSYAANNTPKTVVTLAQAQAKADIDKKTAAASTSASTAAQAGTPAQRSIELWPAGHPISCGLMAQTDDNMVVTLDLNEPMYKLLESFAPILRKLDAYSLNELSIITSKSTRGITTRTIYAAPCTDFHTIGNLPITQSDDTAHKADDRTYIMLKKYASAQPSAATQSTAGAKIVPVAASALASAAVTAIQGGK